MEEVSEVTCLNAAMFTKSEIRNWPKTQFTEEEKKMLYVVQRNTCHSLETKKF